MSVGFLKKHGYLAGGYSSGTMTWTHGWSGNKSSIGIVGCVYGDDPHFRLHYTHTGFDGVKTDLDYKVEVVSTPCYFGGKRYWWPASRDWTTYIVQFTNGSRKEYSSLKEIRLSE
jgi:hypothetical protein